MTEPVDFLFVNGHVCTMDAACPRVSAIAIRNGHIVARGDDNTVLTQCGKANELIDLHGRLLVPGLVDGHAHPTKGAIAGLFSCRISFDDGPAQIESALARFASEQPDVEWIFGGRWGSGFFQQYALESPRRWLDTHGPERPIYLRDDSGHNGWANTRALEQLGISAASVDPEGGRIVREAHSGEPNGLLLEQADVEARARIPDWSAAQYRAGVLEMARIAAAYGITGITDADASEALLRAYRDIDAGGELHLHVVASITTPYGARHTPLDYAHLEALRDRYASTHVDTRFVKIYQDGVPTAARTAAMLEPYVGHADYPSDYRGLLHVDPDTLANDLYELERRGFTVKLHTCGDRAVRVALDAIENAHRLSGRSDLRHELAHAGLVAQSDIPRFRALNVVADLSPYVWYPSPLLNSVRGAIGTRVDRYWPIRDLLESGAPLLAGSDWPAAVASMDPWPGLQAMVTRADPSGKTSGTLWPEQAIGVAEALKIFTLDGARAQRRDGISGSIEIGKSADLIVLDRDLFEIDPASIKDTQVEMTFFEGALVHSA